MQQLQSKNPREPMLSPETPRLPWIKVGSDLSELNGKICLVLVDYYSSYIEVEKLRSATSQSVITVCKQNFARYGIHHELIMGWPCYASDRFQQFTS